MTMRAALGVLVLSLLPTQTLAQQDAAGIEAVIRDQMTDFQADDWEGAFDHASPTIQGIFRTPDIFGQMVRQGYPMVWRPADIRFGTLRHEGGRLLQTVVVSDESGRIHELEYEMIPIGDGWKINGVRLVREGQLGA